MKKAIVVLIVGIIISLLGGYINIQYKKQGVSVKATITEIKTDDDSYDYPATYTHYYYGEYVFDGKKYTDEKLDSHHSDSQFPKYHVGDTIEVIVNPVQPTKVMTDGSLLMFVGCALAILGLINLNKKKNT